jgi:hypothetical protein
VQSGVTLNLLRRELRCVVAYLSRQSLVFFFETTHYPFVNCVFDEMFLVDYGPDSDTEEKSLSAENEKDLQGKTSPTATSTPINSSAQDIQSKKRVVDFILPISVKSLHPENEEQLEERPIKRPKTSTTIFDVLPQPKSYQSQVAETKTTIASNSSEEEQERQKSEDPKNSSLESEENEENFFGIVEEKEAKNKLALVNSNSTQTTNVTADDKKMNKELEETSFIGPAKPPSLDTSSSATMSPPAPPQPPPLAVPHCLPPYYPHNQSAVLYPEYSSYISLPPQATPERSTNQPLSGSFLSPELQQKSFEIPENEEIVEINAASLLKDRAPNPLIRDFSAAERQKLREASMQGKPSLLQKRKHQIHYLAWEAKQRELELIERRTQAIRTKQETQSKYGW